MWFPGRMGGARGLVRAAAVLLAVVAADLSPVAAQDVAELAVDVPLLAPEYLAAFDEGVLPGTSSMVEPGPITGDTAVDRRIRELAEDRGYRLRATASVPLEEVDGRALQPSAATAWRELQNAAAADGVAIVLTSAHRTVEHQRRLFLGRLGGTSDRAIEAALRTAAPPGYSKHHTGYAVDIGQPGQRRGSFHLTAAFDWLAADNYANARRHGWVPSYPVFGSHMGPDPEAWEFVWVGPANLQCVVADARTADAADATVGFCDGPGSAAAADIEWLDRAGVTSGCRPGRYCTDSPVTRGELASMVWRLLGRPEADRLAPFVDVYTADHFAPAVDWLWSEGFTTGTSPRTFSPDRPLRAAELLALLVRLDEAPSSVAARQRSVGAAPATSTTVTRGELASVLRWWWG